MATLTSSCAREVVNSADNDEAKNNFDNLVGSAEFKATIPAVLKKCATCHEHAAWYKYNEADYEAVGLVVAYQPSLSPLYFRNVNATEGPTGYRNMPQGGGAMLTDSEMALLKDWIENYAP